jgi:hypothetical protein
LPLQNRLEFAPDDYFHRCGESPYIYSTGRFEAEPDSSSGRRLSLCVIPLHPDLPSGVLALLSEQAVPVIAADVVPNTSTEPRARPV